jgi:hypothetical protein
MAWNMGHGAWGMEHGVRREKREMREKQDKERGIEHSWQGAVGSRQRSEVRSQRSRGSLW